MAGSVPTHRHRSKSAPRGRSPDGKLLKKVAKGLETPPPKKKAEKGSSTASGSGKKPKPKEGQKEEKAVRKLSFGSNTTTDIIAKNQSGSNSYGKEGNDDIKKRKADEIFRALKKELSGGEPFSNHGCPK